MVRINELNCDQSRKELKSRGAKTSGKKHELISRLQAIIRGIEITVDANVSATGNVVNLTDEQNEQNENVTVETETETGTENERVTMEEFREIKKQINELTTMMKNHFTVSHENPRIVSGIPSSTVNVATGIATQHADDTVTLVDVHTTSHSSKEHTITTSSNVQTSLPPYITYTHAQTTSDTTQTPAQPIAAPISFNVQSSSPAYTSYTHAQTTFDTTHTPSQESAVQTSFNVQPSVPVSAYTSCTHTQPVNTHNTLQQTRYTQNVSPTYHAHANTSSFNNVKDVIEVLPKFNPNSEMSLSSNQFVKRIDQLQRFYNWDEHTLLFAVQMKLKGSARIWNDGRFDLFMSWENFARELMNKFPGVENEADIHLDMASTVRKYKEPVEEYFYKMCAKGDRYKLSEQAIIKYIRLGLNYTTLQNSIPSLNFESTNELLKTIKRFAENSSIENRINRTNLENRTNRITRTSGENPNAQSEPKTIKTARPSICYNYYELGHLSIECPKPQRRIRCTICTKSGHDNTKCPTLTDKRA